MLKNFAIKLFVPLFSLLLMGACTTQYTDAESDVAATADYYEDEPGIDLYEIFDPELVDAVGMFAELDYHGQWYEMRPWGWVWRPTVVLEWRPYIYGEWMWTNVGWTWISYEPFGWAVYHYGFWLHDFALGWVWVPDFDWFPERVMWVQTEHHIGWAPLPADERAFGDPWQEPGDIDPWVIVSAKNFYNNNVGRYGLVREQFVGLPWSRATREPPEQIYVQELVGRVVRPVHVSMTETTVGDVVFQKMELPMFEQQRIDQIRAELGNPAITPPTEPPPGDVQDPSRPPKTKEAQEKDKKDDEKKKREKKGDKEKKEKKEKKKKEQG